MTMHQIIVETYIEHEDDYVIFAAASQDVWHPNDFTYSVCMYKPIHLINGQMVFHPYAYENAEATCYLRRKGFGFVTLETAMNQARYVTNGVTYLIETLGVKLSDVGGMTK